MPSPFFTEQLTAFEVWLDHGSENKKPPESTCVIFFLMLAFSGTLMPPSLLCGEMFVEPNHCFTHQGHRFSMVLLGRFLDMGPWLEYSVCSKASHNNVSRQILVFIWTMILALDKSASHVHGGLLAAGFFDGSVKLYDARIPELLVCTMRPHVQKVEKVVGIGFQPGLDSGDIQFRISKSEDRYLTIDAHRGSLTALAVHRHAPILASGSAKQLIKVFSLDGDQLGTIRYHQQACFHCWWNQT
ncbi:hypothetical protein IC575_026244 [Cucumis melo]